MILLHTNDWGYFKTETLIIDGGFGMVSIDYEKDKPEVAMIHDLSVIPPARKNGMAKALLTKAIEQAREHNCKYAELNYCHQVTPQWVYNWYERNGFEEVGFGNWNTLMRKTL